uniref:Uncharacterized protein n=1 Tax=Arundo donax TaxID=35708 RepID=A0A0A9BEH7_ARUDO
MIFAAQFTHKNKSQQINC